MEELLKERQELLDEIGDHEATDNQLLDLMEINFAIYEEEQKGKPKWVKPGDLP